MRVIGIDPGTRTYDFVVLEDGIFAEELTMPTEVIKKKPEEKAGEDNVTGITGEREGNIFER